jgi:hypothetical protein
MKKLILVALSVLSLGVGSAWAATSGTRTQTPNDYNWLQGGD